MTDLPSGLQEQPYGKIPSSNFARARQVAINMSVNREAWLREIALVREGNDRLSRNSDQRVMIIRRGDVWSVCGDHRDGVGPTTEYDSAEKAAARALQLMRLTAPVTPQSWPERIEIRPENVVTHEKEDPPC